MDYAGVIEIRVNESIYVMTVVTCNNMTGGTEIGQWYRSGPVEISDN
jgi:hypothetical protein